MDLGKAPEAGTIALIIVTAAITAVISTLMGTFGKSAAEGLLNLILRPFRFVKERVYSWIAPRNPLSISLRSYKRHVSRSNLTRIENPVGPNLEVPLEHAFAPLKLISGATEESVDLFAQAAASYRCIVLGGPGTGKTTLMKSLVTGVVKGRVREEALKDLIPVFVVLRNLAKREHTVEQAVVAAFADHHFPGAEKFVTSALEQGKLLVILDGLDEVGASRDFVAARIQEFCEYDDQRTRRNRLLVTCREHSYRTKDLQGVIPEVVRVEPFANHHMRVFLQGWPAHKGRTAMKLYGLIQDDPQIRDICRNPLLLTILTGLYLDTDNFELPSSRERFYKDAVDELLVHRPARRNVRQAFDADDKRQILERVALDRLETAARHEDPEEFTREVIRRKAEEVLRQDRFDPRELIEELVQVNGIIKPGHEGIYTCAHRTIQEYFAAREARRKRETREVVEHFGGRPEFIEVLYFYCGLVENLPALAYVVNTLISQQRWLEAGRCILHMKEPPDRALVARVARELHDLVSPSVEYKAALEVLSSLAQRRAPEFDPARDLFAQAIDRLADGYGESGASALESALATSPEAAMKVIPILLKHRSPRWRQAAVQLLRDIGTGEALDQLVQLVNPDPAVSPDPFVRAQAGRTLVGMLKSRPHDLRARAALLPPRADAEVWPLEEYFPGRLAIPIAESLVDGVYMIDNRAVDYAVFALRARADGYTAYIHRHLKLWRRVPLDLKLRRWRRRAGRALALTGYALTLACISAGIILQFWAYRTNQAFVLTLSPPLLQRIEGRWLNQVQSRAGLIAEEIRQRHPPNASGLSRLLPWNWSIEPELWSSMERAYEAVSGWASHPNPYRLSDRTWYVEYLKVEIADDKVAALEESLAALEQNSPPLQTQGYILINPSDGFLSPLGVITGFLLVCAAFVSNPSFFPSRRRPTQGGRKAWARPRDVLARLGDFYSDEGALSNAILILLGTVSGVIYFGTTVGGQGFWMLPLLPPLAIVGGGALLQRLSWPNNQLIPAVADILPHQDRGIAEEEPDEESARQLANILRTG